MSQGINSIKNIEDDLKNRAVFQQECCLHWIKICEDLIEKFDEIVKEIEALDEDSYDLDIDREQKELDLEERKELISNQIQQHLQRSEMEKVQLDKVNKELRNHSLIKAIVQNAGKKKS